MLHWLKRLTRPAQTPARPPEAIKTLDLPAPPALGPAPRFLSLGGGASRARQLGAYQGWVFAAVNVIAQRVAGVPLRLFAEAPAGAPGSRPGPAGSSSKGPEVTQHPLLDLLARPNPILSGRQLRFTLTLHLELAGMAFCLVNRNALGRPAELWPLSPADLVEIKSGDSTARPITGFVFSGPGGGRVTYAPEEILYLRHPSPQSLIYGASPIQAMAHIYDIDLAVRIYQKAFFQNSARPEVVLATDQRLTEQEAKRILTRWNQKHQGLAQAFSPTVLDGGLKAQTLTFSHKDFEFMALAGWTQDNILAAYGVPAGKLGLVKDVNRANAQAIDATFNAECVRPRLDLMEDALNAFLAPAYGHGLVLKHDNPVPSDREQQHTEAMDQLDRGAITINEFRARQGLAPVAWGDAPYQAPSGQDNAATAQAPSAITGQGSKQAATPAHGWQGLAALLAARHYPRLQARFAGWSRARVEAELDKRPGLLAGLVPPGLGEHESNRLKACLAAGLAADEPLERLLPRLLAG